MQMFIEVILIMSQTQFAEACSIQFGHESLKLNELKLRDLEHCRFI